VIFALAFRAGKQPETSCCFWADKQGRRDLYYRGGHPQRSIQEAVSTVDAKLGAGFEGRSDRNKLVADNPFYALLPPSPVGMVQSTDAV